MKSKGCGSKARRSETHIKDALSRFPNSKGQNGAISLSRQADNSADVSGLKKQLFRKTNSGQAGKTGYSEEWPGKEQILSLQFVYNTM